MVFWESIKSRVENSQFIKAPLIKPGLFIATVLGFCSQFAIITGWYKTNCPGSHSDLRRWSTLKYLGPANESNEADIVACGYLPRSSLWTDYLHREVGLSIQSLSLSFTMSSTFKKVTRNLSCVGFVPQAKHNLLPKLTLMMMGLVIKLWTSIHPLQLPIKPLLHKSSSFGSVPLITISIIMSLWLPIKGWNLGHANQQLLGSLTHWPIFKLSLYISPCLLSWPRHWLLYRCKLQSIINLVTVCAWNRISPPFAN